MPWQGEFEGVVAVMCVDKEIDAASVFGEHGALVFGQMRNVRLGNGLHAHAAGEPVGGKRAGSEYLGQRASAESAQSIHLPQSILGCDITLQENGILPGS